MGKNNLFRAGHVASALIFGPNFRLLLLRMCWVLYGACSVCSIHTVTHKDWLQDLITCLTYANLAPHYCIHRAGLLFIAWETAKLASLVDSKYSGIYFVISVYILNPTITVLLLLLFILMHVSQLPLVLVILTISFSKGKVN